MRPPSAKTDTDWMQKFFYAFIEEPERERGERKESRGSMRDYSRNAAAMIIMI